MTTDRVRDSLRRLSAAGLSLVACACLVVLAAHESDRPWLWGWSPRYVLAAVVPVLAYVGAQGALILLRPLRADLDRYVAVGCLLSGPLFGVVGVMAWHSYVGAVLAASLGVLALPLAGYRAFRTGQWLLTYVAVVAVCLALVLPDVAGSFVERPRREDHRLTRWGDLFRHRWPEAEPFISAGGNLQPNVDLDLYTDDPRRPPYHLKTNSAGFRNDHEIPLVGPPGELRILNMGDSFSVGYGVDQDRFVGPLLESRWRRAVRGRPITVLNAEVSDPAYGLFYLQRHGVRYAPDVVLYTYVDNDSHQAYLPVAVKGLFSLDSEGVLHAHPTEPVESKRRVQEAHAQFARHLYPRASAERLQRATSPWTPIVQWLGKPTGSLRELRSLESVFGLLTRLPGRDERDNRIPFIGTLETSHTSGHLRLIDFGSNWGMLYKQGREMTAPLYANLFSLLESMRSTAAKHGAVFALVYVPRREQVQPRDWRRFQAFWNLDPDDFDLDLEASTLKAFCDGNGIPFVDTTPAMRAAALRGSLHIFNDNHLNNHGQAAAAEAIFEFMQRYQ